jgi:arsenical pump membrane protein
MRIVATLAIFVTMLALVIAHPRRWNEAWWTVLAALTMLALGLVSPRQAVATTLASKNALLFLLALLLLSMLIGESGFFDWAAIRSARLARDNGRSLYRNTFLLGALVSATLSLDTTAVMLTPVVLALVSRLELPATPYIVLCAFVANVGSLLLPISNLTNLLFADQFKWTFATFAVEMLIPQSVALALTYALLRRYFAQQIPTHFAARALAEPASVVPNRAYFVACAIVLGVVLIGYFVAPLLGLPVYLVAFAGCVVLVYVGARTGRVRFRSFGRLSWGVFPFVVGLFVAVRGLENLGIVELASGWLQHAPHTATTTLEVAGATMLGANVLNNLPAALLARSMLSASTGNPNAVFAALIGVDVGSVITPFGSLATMLVLALARREGVQMRASAVLIFGLWATPLIVLATSAALIVQR